MEETAENPCLACSPELNCCRNLCGLRLTPVEFDRVFKDVQEQIIIEKSEPYYVISAQPGGGCPLWEGQCTVYDLRPRECRLSPLSIGRIFANQKRIYATCHDRTSCPKLEELRPGDPEAKAMITSFIEEVYATSRLIRIEYETFPVRLRRFAMSIGRKLGLYS